MASLEGQTVQNRFRDLIQVSNANSGIDATKRAVSDGEGTASKLELSTTAVNIASGFELNGTAAQTGDLLKHEVGGLEFDASAVADGGVVVGTGAGAMAIRTSFLTAGAAGFVKHELGGIEADISAITTDQFLGGTALGTMAIRTAAQVRTSLGLVIGTDVQADLDVPSQAEAEAGTATTERVWTAQRVGQGVAALSGLKFLATADASNDATLDFTAFDATKYDAYLFVLANVIPATDNVSLYVRTSTDGGSGYDSGASDYAHNALTRADDDADDTIESRGGSTAQINLTHVIALGSDATEQGWSGKVFVFGPHLAKKTQITAEGIFIDSAGNFRSIWLSATRNSAADVDAIRFLMSSGNIESGTITMYGIRNS